MTAAGIKFDWSDPETVATLLDPALGEGIVGYRTPTGDRLCAACGCPEHAGDLGPGHCGQCGCLTGKGTDDECVCAKFVAEIAMCPHCGARFPARWQLQNHLMPSPTCLASAFGAAGKFAQKPSYEPPLLAAQQKVAR